MISPFLIAAYADADEMQMKNSILPACLSDEKAIENAKAKHISKLCHKPTFAFRSAVVIKWRRTNQVGRDSVPGGHSRQLCRMLARLSFCHC